jgi:HEAT repeat protein
MGCLAIASLGLCGCAGFWDDVTSHDFKFNSLFVTPNPLLTLKESTDGDQRSKALRSLREPRQNGGSDQDQDFVVQLLTTAASAEHQALCRLSAIQALGHFQDPRAIKGLEDAYYRAEKDYRDGKLPLETASAIQCSAVKAMGDTGNPASVPILVRIVGEANLEGAEKDQQQALDKRIAAARSLSHFNSYQATEALVKLLQAEKDTALRDSAHDSLVHITGKDLPPDYEPWNALLNQAPGSQGALAQQQGAGSKLRAWVGVGN